MADRRVSYSDPGEGDIILLEKDTTTKIHRSLWVFLFVFSYISLAVYAWTVICSQSERVVSDFTDGTQLVGHNGPYQEPEDIVNTAKNHLKAARIVQSIVSLLTIPLTSAVCSRAAASFAQCRKAGVSPVITLRQTIALADKGWADVGVILKLVMGKWRQYGSRLLFIAIMLNVLGKITIPTTTPRLELNRPRVNNIPLTGTAHIIQDN